MSYRTQVGEGSSFPPTPSLRLVSRVTKKSMSCGHPRPVPSLSLSHSVHPSLYLTPSIPLYLTPSIPLYLASSLSISPHPSLSLLVLLTISLHPLYLSSSPAHYLTPTIPLSISSRPPLYLTSSIHPPYLTHPYFILYFIYLLSIFYPISFHPIPYYLIHSPFLSMSYPPLVAFAVLFAFLCGYLLFPIPLS